MSAFSKAVSMRGGLLLRGGFLAIDEENEFSLAIFLSRGADLKVASELHAHLLADVQLKVPDGCLAPP